MISRVEHLDAGDAELLRRALDAVRLTADAFAALLLVDRRLVDGYLARPHTMPFPARYCLAALVEMTRPCDASSELARLVRESTMRQSGAFMAEQFRLLRHAGTSVIRDRLNRILAAHPMAHPGIGVPSATIDDLARGGRISVDEFVAVIQSPTAE